MDDIGNYRLHIIDFLSNTKRNVMYYPCKNSYHRKLVHNFYDDQNLHHETIKCISERKKGCCNTCNKPGPIITKNKYYSYDIHCPNCNYISHDWTSLNLLVHDRNVFVTTTKIKICKI